jgi:Type II secretion system (T2SS), protein E, N-terminal domain
MRIGEMLVRMGVLTRTQVEAVLDEQQTNNEAFGSIAERLFQIPPETIERAWIEQTQERATIFDADRGVDDDARELVVRRQAWQFGIVPLRIDDGYLVAATSRKQLPRAVRFATRVLGMPVQFEIAEDDELAKLLAVQYPMRGMDKSIFDGTAFANLFTRRAA